MAVRKRRATRKYIAERRNGHYTSTKAPIKSGNTCVVEVALHKVKRKLHFGRKPPTPRENETVSNRKNTKREKSLKRKEDRSPQRKQDRSPQRKHASPQKERRKRKLSKEILDLLEMADHFIFTEKLRSKNLARHRMSYGDQPINHGAYKLHSSPEFTNLTNGRQN